LAVVCATVTALVSASVAPARMHLDFIAASTPIQFCAFCEEADTSVDEEVAINSRLAMQMNQRGNRLRAPRQEQGGEPRVYLA